MCAGEALSGYENSSLGRCALICGTCSAGHILCDSLNIALSASILVSFTHILAETVRCLDFFCRFVDELQFRRPRSWRTEGQTQDFMYTDRPARCGDGLRCLRIFYFSAELLLRFRDDQTLWMSSRQSLIEERHQSLREFFWLFFWYEMAAVRYHAATDIERDSSHRFEHFHASSPAFCAT